MDRLPDLAPTSADMRTDEEMRELLLPMMKGGAVRFVLNRAIVFGVLWAFGETVIEYLFGTNRMRVVTALVWIPILAIVFGTALGIFNWYYLRRRYKIPSA
jgi:hypothetical protein